MYIVHVCVCPDTLVLKLSVISLQQLLELDYVTSCLFLPVCDKEICTIAEVLLLL